MVIDHVYTENVCIGQVPYYVPLFFLFSKYSNTATGCFIMYVTDTYTLYLKNVITMLYGIIILY